MRPSPRAAASPAPPAPTPVATQCTLMHDLVAARTATLGQDPVRQGGLMATSEDVITAAAVLTQLTVRNDQDAAWANTALPTTWTASATVEHVADALLFYAGQVARRADRRLPVLRDGRTAPPSGQVDIAGTAAHVLTAVLRDLGEHRAWHPSGLADASGWAAMAVTELLVHGHDTARALGLGLHLPEDVCARTVDRVFPWVRTGRAPAATLLLAVTGRAQVDGVPNDPQWWWHSAPLAEWDGRPRRRTVAPNWR